MRIQWCKASKRSQTHVQQQGNAICLTCPKCNASELSSNRASQLQDLDTTCKCKSCKQLVRARDWMCRCHVNWHLCNIHQSCSNLANAKSASRSNSCRGRKRAIGPLTHEELEEIDARRIRATPRNLLPPAPNILSVNLRERFAYLFKDGS